MTQANAKKITDTCKKQYGKVVISFWNNPQKELVKKLVLCFLCVSIFILQQSIKEKLWKTISFTILHL